MRKFINVKQRRQIDKLMTLVLENALKFKNQSK